MHCDDYVMSYFPTSDQFLPNVQKISVILKLDKAEILIGRTVRGRTL